MDKFNQFDVNEQYDKEAALKYGDTDYYQSYKIIELNSMIQRSKIMMTILMNNSINF